MSNFQIHELTSGTIDRDSNVIHDTLNGGNYETRKATAGAVADLANVNVAAPYDPTTTYSIGQYCLQEGNIYRCIAPTTGAFDSTAWTQIVVTGEFRRVVELTSAQYTALSSAEKNNGTLYIITDEETTAADIPYSQGVSVADKLDSLSPTYTGISTVSDTIVNATNKDIYTTHLNKGIYIINASVLWKTSGTAQGLGIYIYSDNSLVAQDLEYTVGWCVQNLNTIINIPTDNTEIIVRLYQTTGSNIAVEFNGNITKL